ncbi:MAG: hypothetical protein Ta2B_06840 [Termitinemataceae bacterium]|nr:MAG: hypothetical protein Ta2B_06840 [Termitinemataceae bacterium]
MAINPTISTDAILDYLRAPLSTSGTQDCVVFCRGLKAKSAS